MELARAIYTDRDIVLLDDVLSAVDNEAGAHIMKEAILGMLGGKTRVLCTHALQYLKDCDRVVVMHEGKITHGPATFDELVAAGVDFAAEIDAQADSTSGQTLEGSSGTDDGSKAGNGSYTAKNDEDSSLIIEEHREAGAVTIEGYRTYFERMGKTAACIWIGAAVLATMTPAAGRFVLAHWSEITLCEFHRAYGNTTTGCLERGYTEADNSTWTQDEDCMTCEPGHAACADPSMSLEQMPAPFLDECLLTICRPRCGDLVDPVGATSACCTSGQNNGTVATCPLGFRRTADSFCPDGGHCLNSTCGDKQSARDSAMQWYRSSGFALISLSAVAGFAACIGRLRASRSLHQDMVSSVLSAQVIAFYDATPVGRIMNRFAADMDAIDTGIPGALEVFVTCLANLASYFLTLSEEHGKISVLLFHLQIEILPRRTPDH